MSAQENNLKSIVVVTADSKELLDLAILTDHYETSMFQ